MLHRTSETYDDGQSCVVAQLDRVFSTFDSFKVLWAQDSLHFLNIITDNESRVEQQLLGDNNTARYSSTNQQLMHYNAQDTCRIIS